MKLVVSLFPNNQTTNQMTRIKDIEPCVNNYRKSNNYGVPFGVYVWYKDHRETYMFDDALCLSLTKSQREYVKTLKEMGYNNQSIYATNQ